MSPDRDHWFRELEPPPGGVERFRRRLETHGRPRARLALAAAGVAAAVIAIALVVALDPGREPGAPRSVASVYEASQFDRLLGRPLEPTELSVTRDEPSSVARVESSDPRIRIYDID